jgi:hypothetical protein
MPRSLVSQAGPLAMRRVLVAGAAFSKRSRMFLDLVDLSVLRSYDHNQSRACRPPFSNCDFGGIANNMDVQIAIANWANGRYRYFNHAVYDCSPTRFLDQTLYID